METGKNPKKSLSYSDSESDFFDEIIDDISEFVDNEENADNCIRKLMLKIRNLLYKLINNL